MSIGLGTRFRVAMEDVFTHGAYFRTVEPDNDFDLVRARAADPQKRDKETGERLWVVTVLDGDPEARTAEVKVRIVDVHAEATSEKVAMGWHLDGRVSVVVGTHTHVQTADERILPEGTAYLTDLGMTGSYAGVIGMNKTDVIARFTSAIAKRAEHSSGQVRICAAVIDVDETTGHARSIERLNLGHEH